MTNQQESVKQLSRDTLEALYYVAHTNYKQGKYEDSAAIFRYLTLEDTRTRKHWMGLGSSFQMLKKYQKAIEAFEIAVALEPGDPLVHMQAADCLFGLGNVKDALFALECAERAVKLGDFNEDGKNLLAHIALIRKAWDNPNQ